jgi:hypothetical protein
MKNRSRLMAALLAPYGQLRIKLFANSYAPPVMIGR